ncbi:MAG TPA: NADH-quinone oxidoreductase subunit N [Vicinamibacterales bacterium]|nr:NADH-quinone oxidoreductase subunit N [Vicinamibacterales bacterium]
MTESWFAALVPTVCVTAAALAAMVVEAFRRPGERPPIGLLGAIGLVAALVACVALWDADQVSFGMVRADNFGLFASAIVLVAALLSVALSGPAIEREGLPPGEYYTLMLFAVSGMVLMAMAIDLLTIFLALEILSIGVYVLTGLRRDRLASSEGAFKYFLLGSFSSAFFLYGVALTYALTGSTRLEDIGRFMAAEAMNASPMMLFATAMLLVGFAFKISAVPFHMWTPDAYEGAPAIVTGFMSTAVKAAAFAAFVRVFLSALEPLRGDWAPVLWVVAMLTMILGTVVGVAQSNLKRMLAYSSIAHAGYLLVGLIAANEVGKAGILFYLLVYAVSNLGAFGVIVLMGTRENPRDELADFTGLWHSRPGLAALMAIFLLSLGGLPPTAGFVAKWYVFSAAVRAGYYDLAVVGMLTSVISVFFYLRVVVMMYMAEPAGQPARPVAGTLALSALAVTTAAVFYLGILPTRVLDLAASSVATIF